MKKIITIIVAILVSVVANAQIVRSDYMGKAEKVEFHLGDYTFVTGLRFYGDEISNYNYCLYLDDSLESIKVWNFIVSNKEKIEEKYGVILENISYERVCVSMKVYTPSEYQYICSKREKESNDRLNRLNSLNTL